MNPKPISKITTQIKGEKMKNGKTLANAIKQKYVQPAWISILDNPNDLQIRNNHMVYDNVQIMEINKIAKTNKYTYLIKPEPLIEATDITTREKIVKTLSQKGLNALEQGRIIFELCVLFGKKKTTNDGRKYIEPWNADALDKKESLDLAAIASTLSNLLLNMIAQKYHTKINNLKPQPLILAYQWNTKDVEGTPECPHFHLMLSCQITEEEKKRYKGAK